MEIIPVLSATIVILLVYLFYKYFIEINNYWRKKGVPTVKGALPIIGNSFNIFCTHKSVSCFYNDVYRSNGERSMIGFFEFRKPMLLLRDPDLIKTVLISDFRKFHKNVLSLDEKADPLLSKNPFFTSGDEWKNARSRVSHVLNSSKRLKILCDPVTQVCQKLDRFVMKNIEKTEKRVYEVEAKELCNRYTGEVVARAGFGIEGESFEDEIVKDSFRDAVNGFLDVLLYETIKQTILFILPSLNSLFRLSLLPEKIDRLFRRLVHEIICNHERNGIFRNDFVHMTMEKRMRDKSPIDKEIITADATSFFLDTYETSAVTMSLFLYQLAENPDVQTKLRDEVKTCLEKHNDVINYESLDEMIYMDQALNESMRLHPALGSMVKVCNEPCKLTGKDGLECAMEPGMEIVIPIRALHRDPDYWENPDVYDPERFSTVHKAERHKMAFLPFSEGPRICVGMKFALMQMKAAVATVIRDFVIDLSPKTKRPLTYKRSAILTAMEGGLWINLKPL